ncbi:bZIP transcription factor TGA10 [Amaranthus tricolor]|uniref:bZIP transcription factor TGA10 n=1 Tax=Amaranthus tricolor TaxID=29722 RepID=UPI0025905CD4|nr:bZIP transcription factor TGA10 [Amaranthus tricolor]
MGFLKASSIESSPSPSQNNPPQISHNMNKHTSTSTSFVHPFISTTSNHNHSHNYNHNTDNHNNNDNIITSLELQQFSLLHHQQQQQHQQNISFSMMQSSPSSSSLPGNNFMGSGKENNSNTSNNTTGAYDLGELDQALFLYLDGQTDHEQLRQNHNSSSTSSPGGGGAGGGMRPPTLNIFPSQPMHVEPSTKAKTGGVQGGGQSRPSEQPPPIELSNNNNSNNNNKNKLKNDLPAEQSKPIKREGNRKGPTSSSEQEGPKTPDPKTLRRLAQNREAARKSRLRKKAYVQQLESSRIRLAQLEQELQRARAQGIFFGGGLGGGGDQGIPVGVSNISSDAAVFDLEYTRWLEEHHRLTCELRAAVQEHIPENELKIYVDNCLAHYDIVMNLKGMVAKSDVFHLVSGMWKTPAERCFMWMGGFRPSELIKIILHQIEPLSDQQLMGICGLQQSTQEAEDALSQGLDALQQSLSDVIASDSLSCPPNMNNYMGQMALAMNKLSTMENFVRQADSLRHQTLHRLHQILTTRQAARCFLTIAEYFHRLRALSSMWMARPRQE